MRRLPVARLLALGLCSAAVVALTMRCAEKKNVKDMRQGPQQGAQDATGLTKALNLSFVWDAKDLPACFGNRHGARVYVWRAQVNYGCDQSTGSWQPTNF